MLLSVAQWDWTNDHPPALTYQRVNSISFLCFYSLNIWSERGRDRALLPCLLAAVVKGSFLLCLSSMEEWEGIPGALLWNTSRTMYSRGGQPGHVCHK